MAIFADSNSNRSSLTSLGSRPDIAAITRLAALGGLACVDDGLADGDGVGALVAAIARRRARHCSKMSSTEISSSMDILLASMDGSRVRREDEEGRAGAPSDGAAAGAAIGTVGRGVTDGDECVEERDDGNGDGDGGDLGR